MPAHPGSIDYVHVWRHLWLKPYTKYMNDKKNVQLFSIPSVGFF